ncbi:MAG: hypothetical protein H6709_05970 [Kofleriaceae bacterium]|nr:hypothetical protein [Kofleriaceae bacterium]
MEIVSRPPGATITVDAAPELPFTAPRSIWLAPGAHDVTVLVDGTPVAATTVRARDGDRAVALLEVPAAAAVTAGDGDATVDFADEAAGEVHTGGPEDVAFGSLLPERYRQALDGRVAWTDEARRGPGRRHRVGLGVAVGRADGVAALGVLLDGEVGFALRRGRAALWLAPSAAIALLEAPRAVGAADDGGRVVQVHGAVAAQLSYALTRRLVTTVGAGPAAAWIAGPTRRDGAQLGALAAVGLAYRGVALHLRAEVPAVSSADVSTATLGAALGLRW